MAVPLLLVAASLANPDMLAASGFPAPDAFVWLELGDRRVAVVTGFDVALARRESRADEVLSADELTREERAGGASRDELDLAVVRNCLRRYQVRAVRVPGWFPLAIAEHLRSGGVDVTIDDTELGDRRRRKDAAAVAALRVIQTIAEQGMILVRDTLAAADHDRDGGLVLAGEPLTSERLRGLLAVFLVEHGAEPGVPIIAGGVHGADPHDVGAGPLRVGEPIVCDLFPRHASLRVFGDMTRTFVVGEPSAEVADAHATCCAVLADAIRRCRPGIRGVDLHLAACERFAAAGYPSEPYPDAPSAWRFPHGLGHGVGYAVHEAPNAGASGRDALRAGDSLTIEPGLYRTGVGGIRVEDLVILTGDGCINLNQISWGLAVA
jgi:Xaa-Pro aminopeptidase